MAWSRPAGKVSRKITPGQLYGPLLLMGIFCCCPAVLLYSLGCPVSLNKIIAEVKKTPVGHLAPET